MPTGANFIDLNAKKDNNKPLKQQWGYLWKKAGAKQRGIMTKNFVRYIGRLDGTAIDENCLDHSLFGKFLDTPRKEQEELERLRTQKEELIQKKKELKSKKQTPDIKNEIKKVSEELDKVQNQIKNFRWVLPRNDEMENLSMREIRRYVENIASRENYGAKQEIHNTVISLTKEDAVSTGFTDRETWKNFINMQVKTIAAEYDISISKLEYVASVHTDNGKVHCHLLFWDKFELDEGRIERKVDWTKIRKDINKEIFRRDLEENYEIQNEGKKKIGSETENFLEEHFKCSMQEYTPHLYETFFDNRIYKGSLKILENGLQEVSSLQESLAKENGKKLSFIYKYQEPEVKEKLLKLAKNIIESSPQVKQMYEKYVNSTAEIQQILGNIGKKNTLEDVKEKAKEEILVKVANNILDFLKEENKEENALKKAKWEERQKEYDAYVQAVAKSKEDYETKTLLNKVRRLSNNNYSTLENDAISRAAKLRDLTNYSNLSLQAKKELALKNKFTSSIDWEI